MKFCIAQLLLNYNVYTAPFFFLEKSASGSFRKCTSWKSKRVSWLTIVRSTLSKVNESISKCWNGVRESSPL